MLQNAYLLAKIGADTAENEQHFAENLPKTGNYPTGPPTSRTSRRAARPSSPRGAAVPPPHREVAINALPYFCNESKVPHTHNAFAAGAAAEHDKLKVEKSTGQHQKPAQFWTNCRQEL